MRQDHAWLRVGAVALALVLGVGFVWYRAGGGGRPANRTAAQAPRKKVPLYLPSSKSGPIMVDEDDPRLKMTTAELMRSEFPAAAPATGPSEVPHEGTLMSGSKSLAPAFKPASTAPSQNQ